jgi:tetratricopeptide (TPR) repeat protein
MAARAVGGGVNTSPYIGNRPFLAGDAGLFHGRSHQSREVAVIWRNAKLTVLSGRSGVGKTSLLRAGVIPSLGAAGADVLPVGRVRLGTAFPVAALPEHNPYTLALLTAWAPGETPTRLSGLTLLDFLRRRQQPAGPDGRTAPVLAAIDRAEDLFTSTGRTDRHRGPFVEELAEVLQELPHVRLLLCLREDYAEAFARYEGLLGTRSKVFTLAPLSAWEALDAVRGPVSGSGRWFAPGAAEVLASGLETDRGVEPALLQVACREFWTTLPDGTTGITSEHVVRYANVAGALDRFCGEAVTAVAADHGLVPGELGSWLSREFVTALGTRGTAYEGLTDTAQMPVGVVRALRDRHVLSAVWRSGARWYELQDDLLIDPVRRAPERLAAVSAESRFSAGDFLRAAQCAIAEGDPEMAARHAQEALQAAVGPDLRLSAEAESLLGNVAHMRGQPAEAESRYRAAAALFEALGDTPAVAALLAAAGQSMLVQERYGAAVEFLYSAVRRIPGDLAVQTRLAWALWHAGQQRAAIDVLSAVLSTNGEAAEARRARGEIFADIGHAEDALRDLDRVRRHQPPSTHAARGLALATLRGPGAADLEIDTALSGAPGSGPVLLYAARVAELERDPVSAADLARRAVNATEPRLPPHQRRQALALMEPVS